VSDDRENRPVPAKSKVRPRDIWFLAGMGGVLLALFVLSLQWKESRKVSEVIVEGNRYFSAKEVRSRAGIAAGTLLDSVRLAAVRGRLVAHPYIRDARVGRAYPGAVTIEIDERTPVASFSVNGVIRYIDAWGVVLPYMQAGVPSDLPGITGIPELARTRAGDAVEGDEFFRALGVLEAALEADSSVYRLISEVDMKNGGDVHIYASESAVPIILGRGDELRKLTLLQAFWEKYVREAGPENLQYLDLRFSDQVVAKWINKPQGTFNHSSTKEGEG
jgi:cell division protein FtsQ